MFDVHQVRAPAFGGLVLLLVLSGVALAAGQDSVNATKILAASAVRMRSRPDPAAEIIATLPLGTIVQVSERSAIEGAASTAGYWDHAALADGTSGWISEKFLIPFDKGSRDEIYRKIAAERLAAKDLSFADRADMLAFLDRVTAENLPRAAKAALELDALLALRNALGSILVENREQPPYKAFTTANSSRIVYSEPASQWMVKSELFWNLRTKYADLPIAERIAWEAAGNPLPGECEGYIPCHVYLALATDGEYLRLFPSGPHSGEALDGISELLGPIIEDLKTRSTYTGPSDASETAELRKNLGSLRAIVGKTTSPKSAVVLKQLGQLAEAYK